MASIVVDYDAVKRAITYLGLYRIRVLNESLRAMRSKPEKSDELIKLSDELETIIAKLTVGDVIPEP